METTERVGLPYPSADEDPWFASFQSFVDAVDAGLFATREDRGAIAMGGGAFAWDAGASLLSWSATLSILSAPTGLLWNLAADSIELSDGEILYVPVVRGPLNNTTVEAAKASSLPANDSAFPLAVRFGNRVYFRNGGVLASMESAAVFDRDADGSGSTFKAPVRTVGKDAVNMGGVPVIKTFVFTASGTLAIALPSGEQWSDYGFIAGGAMAIEDGPNDGVIGQISTIVGGTATLTTGSPIASGTAAATVRPTINGVPLNLGDRVLKAVTPAVASNGLWVVSGPTWTRAPDADTTEKMKVGVVVVGALPDRAPRLWYCNQAGTLGVDAIGFGSCIPAPGSSELDGRVLTAHASSDPTWETPSSIETFSGTYGVATAGAQLDILSKYPAQDGTTLVRAIVVHRGDSGGSPRDYFEKRALVDRPPGGNPVTLIQEATLDSRVAVAATCVFVIDGAGKLALRFTPDAATTGYVKAYLHEYNTP
jgi:hypothetical protein